jgi:hypothetical protein
MNTMRIPSTPLPQSYSKKSASVEAGQNSPGAALEKTTAAATSGVDTESPAAPATTAGKAAKPESAGKLTPAGLLAAQLRFQAMNSEDMNKGLARAAEVINRNIERYQTQHGITPPTPAADPTAGGEPVEGSTGTAAPPLPTADTAPAAGETEATPAVDRATPA